jgi:predicted DNA-binding transcriptional regulator AlpA
MELFRSKMERSPVNTEAIHTGPSLTEILLMEEVSELTRIPMSTLRFYRHAGQGQGPRSFRLGGRVCYKRSDVLDWIESRYNDDTAGQRAG